MSKRVAYSIAVLLVLAVSASSASAQNAEKAAADKPVMVMAGQLAYSDIAVPGFQPGMQIAVLAGDPAQPAAYTLRLKFPDKYAFPPHWHPNTENLTVLSGTFFLGMGDKENKDALQAYHAGDFLVAPARQPHFGRVQGETVVQLHGIGPFDIKLVGQQ